MSSTSEPGSTKPEDGGGDRLGGADGDQHLGLRVEVHPVAALALGGDGLPQRRDARPRRVLVDAVGDRLLRGLEHGGRAVLVREALAQVDRVEARGQCRHRGEDVDRVRLQALDRHRSAGDMDRVMAA